MKEFFHGDNIGLIKKLKENHILMMMLCCLLPLIVILILRYSFNINSNYLVWGALIICIGSHFFMMKAMHHTENDKSKKSGGDCH